MSSPGKEDDERERRRWRGKLGIKGSLRAASSVLTLSPGRLVDITEILASSHDLDTRTQTQTWGTRSSTRWTTKNKSRREVSRRESKRKTSFFGVLIFNPPRRFVVDVRENVVEQVGKETWYSYPFFFNDRDGGYTNNVANSTSRLSSKSSQWCCVRR